MTYINTLPGWNEIEKKFNDAGYKLEFDLSNTPYILKGKKNIDYKKLPENLQTAIDEFAERHNLNN